MDATPEAMAGSTRTGSPVDGGRHERRPVDRHHSR